MFCEKCGSKQEDAVNFCEACGTPLSPEAKTAELQSEEHKTESKQEQIVSLSRNSVNPQAAAGSFILAGIVNAISSILHAPSPDLIMQSLLMSFWRGPFPVLVGVFLMLSGKRNHFLAISLCSALGLLSLIDLCTICSMANLWDLDRTMGVFGVRLVSDLIILWSLLFRATRFGSFKRE